MAYTTAGGTKKKVCYYYDGMGTLVSERGAHGDIWQASCVAAVFIY